MKIVTCTAPVNIAVIKYWGKRDETLILPINDSVSLTLSSEHMHSKTTVAASPDFETDRIWLNGKEESFDNPRLANCLREVRKRTQASGDELKWKVHICSENNFPTAAGLASSAAGYACLVSSLCELYGVSGDISSLARQGSGSACRSVLGGFVRWHSGMDPAGADSIATQIRPASHWPNMRVLICVAADTRKKVPSSAGMQRSVKTSELIDYRAKHIVPKRTDDIIKAIESRDFESFADITIRDSNQLHAICLDTYPPCVYMNAVSHAVADLVHQINNSFGKAVASYTFDAGPNACIFLPEENVHVVAGLLQKFFPAKDGAELFRGADISPEVPSKETLDKISLDVHEGGLKYIIYTGIGNGPEVLKEGHLLDLKGQPINLST